MKNIWYLSCCLSLFILIVGASDFNPLTSTFKVWSPINGLHSGSQVLPLFVDPDPEIDLVSLEDQTLSWFRNIRGLGGEARSQPITDKKVDEFWHVNFQLQNSNDLILVHSNRTQITLALNPYADGKTSPKDQAILWEEITIYDNSQVFDFDFPEQERFYVSCFMRVEITANQDTDFMVGIQDIQNELPSRIFLIQRAVGSDKFNIRKLYEFEKSVNITLVAHRDVESDGNKDIILLINKKLHAILNKSSGYTTMKLISDLIFPTTYNFRHIYWTDIFNKDGQDMIIIHPSSRKIGVLLNGWDSKQNYYANWEFTEFFKYSLKTRDTADTGVNDFIQYTSLANGKKSLDYVLITKNEIRYYIRDQERKNVTVRGRTTFDVEMNVFHDIPLNLMVWNEDIVNTRIFYVVRMGGQEIQQDSNSVDSLILFSETNGTVSWVEKNKIDLDSVGWETNFWIYIMSYCLFMSIIAGIIHGLMQNQISFYKKDTELLGSPAGGLDFGVTNPFGGFANRRTTV